MMMLLGHDLDGASSNATPSASSAATCSPASFYVSNWYQVWVGLGYTASRRLRPAASPVEPRGRGAVLPGLADRDDRCCSDAPVRAGVADVSRWLLLAAIAITVLIALLYYPGPIGTCATTPEAYWSIGGRSIVKTRHAVPEHVHASRGSAARVGVRVGLAARTR